MGARERRRSAVAAGVVAVGLAVAGCGADGSASGAGGPTSAATPSVVPSVAPSSAGPAAPTTGVSGPERAVPVYYVADTPAGPRLYREFHRVPGSDPGSDAVRELLASPSGTDPDYRSAWPAGTALAAPVTHADGVVTVDLTAQATGASVGAELAELTVQQLVFTVQGALQTTDPVRLLVAGEPVDELWGHVDTSAPVVRADPYAVRSLVQIDEPADGAEVAAPVRVRGEAAVFEATVPWEVRRDGQVVRSGVANSAEGQVFAPYEFTVELAPGEYEIRVTEDDPSGGEGRPPLSDTKRITVTG